MKVLIPALMGIAAGLLAEFISQLLFEFPSTLLGNLVATSMVTAESMIYFNEK